MSQTLSNMIENTLTKIKDMISVNDVVGSPITTPEGVTIIPISKVSVGFGGGGSDFAVKTAQNMGFSNISLDLMIGLPESDNQSLAHSLEYLVGLNPEHISVYILKVEENTAFFKMRDSLSLPDDDKVAEQYLYMCSFLEEKGYSHYEISNFCKEGYESRHNLKYWQLQSFQP